jgi:2-polyprenyl-3-methyl-5-hydroxy-6-metoxy-1,4-benzoquinol methylase
MATSASQLGETADALVERIFEASLATFDIFAIYVGDRLGYYSALCDDGPMTSQQLADIAGTHERYTREWLEHQAVSGIITADPHGDGPVVFSVPSGHAEALTHELSLSYIAPLARMISVAGFKLPDIVEAHRTGGGVSWDAFGDEMRESQGDMNRPAFTNLLTQEWFAGVPDLDAKLTAGARVADIGCGFGWTSIALAAGYQKATVDGFDLDGPSIDAARTHAEDANVADRALFHQVDAGDPIVAGDYDVVAAFECIHDMPDPVSALRTMRRLVADDGIVVVMDERVGDSFDPDADEVEQLMYGFSNFICLPDGLSSEGSVGTGTVMRPNTLRRYAQEAGFTDIEVLPIEADSWRFYRLV